jgi:N-acetyl-gamma-glutamyl-phosphate reductase
MNMGARVAVAGASGYAGGELLRLLAAHPDLEIGPLAAHGSAGAPVTGVHPHLASLHGRQFVPTDAEHLADADLLFTALPHGESAQLASKLPASLKIVDLSADFRLDDATQWQAFYPGDHAGTWTYGLPELPGARDAITAATRVAAPGCYATAAILALKPLVGNGLVDPSGIVIVAASGTSGAGRSLKPHLLAAEVMGSMSAYEVGGTHRHTPEIEQALGPEATVSFTPTLAPMSRGILATSSAPLKAGVTATVLRQALCSAYQYAAFVHLLPEGAWPATASALGSNAAHLQATADTHAGRAVVVSALDNLGKGAAGQAVQIANLMLGLPETAGLTTNGVAP